MLQKIKKGNFQVFHGKQEELRKLQNGGRIGEIDTSYKNLVAVLGNPSLTSNYEHDKVRKEWIIQYKGSIFSIYDYKSYGIKTENIRDWHIGGGGSNPTHLFFKKELQQLLDNVFPELF